MGDYRDKRGSGQGESGKLHCRLFERGRDEEGVEN
jgi:hypothetical protein